jgi:hypothetical protein
LHHLYKMILVLARYTDTVCDTGIQRSLAFTVILFLDFKSDSLRPPSEAAYTAMQVESGTFEQ